MAGSSPEPPRRLFSLQGMKGVGLLSTAGISLVVCSAIGCGIGYWVDKKWHTDPWGIAVGFLLGTAAGFIELFQLVMKANDDE